MVAADSTTDSQLFHGSLISRAFFKKLKQLKIDDAPRRQCLYQWKRANVVGQEESGCSRLSLPHQAWSSIDYDSDETGLSASSSNSPTSVLKNKDSDEDDCFCCSKQVTEEEGKAVVDVKDSSLDDYSDALSKLFEEEAPSQSNKSTCTTAKLLLKDKCKQEDVCLVCYEKMDETDLRFQSCPCRFKLCLFCYKRLYEETGLCPGCRDKYEQSNSGEVSFQQRGRASITLSSSFQGLDRA